MKVFQAAKIWMEYHKANSKKNTIRAYTWILIKFCDQFGDSEMPKTSSSPVLRGEGKLTWLAHWQTGPVEAVTPLFTSESLASFRNSP